MLASTYMYKDKYNVLLPFFEKEKLKIYSDCNNEDVSKK